MNWTPSWWPKLGKKSISLEEIEEDAIKHLAWLEQKAGLWPDNPSLEEIEQRIRKSWHASKDR